MAEHKKLPEIVYVKVEEDRDPEDDILLADEDFSGLSECDSDIEIGEYKLVRKVKVRNTTYIVGD